MGNLLEYSGIVTKIRAMKAKLLTPKQFEEIASLGSVPEIAEYLKKNTAYADVLAMLDESQIHRGNIEKVPVLRTEAAAFYEAACKKLRDRSDQLLSAHCHQQVQAAF